MNARNHENPDEKILIDMEQRPKRCTDAQRFKMRILSQGLFFLHPGLYMYVDSFSHTYIYVYIYVLVPIC